MFFLESMYSTYVHLKSDQWLVVVHLVFVELPNGDGPVAGDLKRWTRGQLNFQHPCTIYPTFATVHSVKNMVRLYDASLLRRA